MSTWYENAVFYHIYPLGLTGAPMENPPGTPIATRFPELEGYLPHIHALGCTAIYIGPLFESTSHGYDTRDFRQIDRRLGTEEDFVRFVRHCHEMRIRVIVDGVFNHTGREFFAFRDIREHCGDSRFRDWYRGINFDWGSPLGDPFCYDAWQGHFELPCLNLQNPEVAQYLFDTVRFWIDTFDIDGIRLDCANVLDFAFMRGLRQRTEAMKPDFWLMGEVIHGEYGRWVNHETLHSVTNYELHKSLYSGLNDHNFFEIAHNVKRLEAVGPRLYTFLENHDEDRIASKLKNRQHLPLAYLLLYTLPGIPSVYYGGEWAIPGRRTNTSDAALRPCIPIGQEPGLHCALTDYIARLDKIHTSETAYAGGRYQELLLTNRQYAFARYGKDSICITVANNDDHAGTVSVPVPVPANNAENLMDASIIPITNGRLSLTLPGNEGVVLKIREG